MNHTVKPKRRPNEAPMVKMGVNTPAGMGQVTASTVSMNLRKEKVKRLKPSAGSDHLRSSMLVRDWGLNKSCRFSRSEFCKK